MMARPKLSAIVVLSFVMTGLTVYSAFRRHVQFYPSMVHIGKSNLTLAVLYFQATVIAIAITKLAKSIFFGSLRSIEIEHLMDRAWYAVTETCLAFTVFRDDFSPRFIGMFMVLLIVKCAHWLAEDRIEYAEQTPSVQSRFHLRMKGLLCLLLVLDSLMALIAFQATARKGPSVQIVFGFEYAILMISAVANAMKYCLYEIDSYSEHQWEDKGTYLLYAELICGFFRVLVYTCFVLILMKLYTLPLFIIRPLYLSCRALKKAARDVVQARRAITNLNNMYPNATEDDLVRNTDSTCIICRDEMQVNQVLKKLPCNHIFHRSCLRSWFQRQQTCPTCRIDVLNRQRQPPQGQVPVGDGVPNQQGGHVDGLSAALFANHAQMLNQPRIILPPFAFPPPPLPNVNLSPNERTDQLRHEEADEADRVLARIETLRNVRNLLDASLIQLNHYLNLQSDRPDSLFEARLREAVSRQSDERQEEA